MAGDALTGDLDAIPEEEEGPALVAGLNFPLAYAHLVEGWDDASALEAYRAYRDAGGGDPTDEEDYEAFRAFLDDVWMKEGE